MLGLGKHKDSPLPSNLQDDRLRFKVIIDSIEDGVVLIDKDGNIQMINPGAAAICGWTVEEATGLNVFSVIKLVDDKGQAIDPQQNPMTRIFSQAQTQRSDIFIMTRSEKQVPISLSLTPLIGQDNVVTAAVAVFRDVSQEKAQEQQRADFISTASHEMRTPVAAIEGYLALALNDKVSTIDNRARDYLEKAHASTQHLGQLFQDLLTSAKAEDGRLTSHPQIVELGAFIEQLSNDLRFAAEKKGLFVEFKSGSGNTVTINARKGESGERTIRPLFFANVDPDRFREVITNLFDNAVKYTPEGKITLGITGDDKVVQCYVKDTGPGIPAEDIPHLFQKFYRVDNSATRTIGGTGLGLFICAKIVELYNGRIWVESEIGKGSSFYINLPRVSSDKAALAQKATAGAAPLPTQTGSVITP